MSNSGETKVESGISKHTEDMLKKYSEILSNNDLSKIDKNSVLDILKKVNPYGSTINTGDQQFLNFSLTQITHEYWKKFIITSFIGFLNRCCDEWKVPTGVPVVTVYDYLADPKLLDTPELSVKRNDKKAIKKYELNREWMKKRVIVKEFLEEIFQFNPDEHVRSAYRPNYKDETRPILDTMAARLAVDNLCKKDTHLRNERNLHETKKGSQVEQTRKVITGRNGQQKLIIRDKVKREPSAKPPSTHPEPIIGTDVKDPQAEYQVTSMIPPADLFMLFNIYYQTHYEEMRSAVRALYCENPLFELAINPYSVHKTQEDADKFKKQHADEVITEVFTAQTGKWNFFDCFKEQRESVNYYNKDTIILEEMTKQMERDAKLGQELMAKRIVKEKKKNIIEDGPDAETFNKWKQENAELSKLNAKYVGDMVNDDVDDDVNEVPIWKIAKGGQEISKELMYIEAAAPTHMKDSAKSFSGETSAPANF